MSHLGTVPSPLTPQQRAILQLVAAGVGTGAIADRLGWDVDAIVRHLAGAIVALGARSVPDAVARAAELELIDPTQQDVGRLAG